MGYPNGQDPYNDPYQQQYSQYPAQGYPMGQQYPGYPMVPGQMQDPDNAMGIVGLILNFVCCGPIGLIVSWIAMNKSKERGYKNTAALVGTILGGISTVMLLIVGIFYLIIIISVASAGTY